MGCSLFNRLAWLIIVSCSQVLAASSASADFVSAAMYVFNAAPSLIQHADEAFFKKLKAHYSGDNRPIDPSCSTPDKAAAFQSGFDSGLSGESYLLPLDVVDPAPSPEDPRDEAKKFKPNVACRGVQEEACCKLGFRSGERSLRTALASVPSGEPISPTCAREMTKGSVLAADFCKASFGIELPKGITLAKKKRTEEKVFCNKDSQKQFNEDSARG